MTCLIRRLKTSTNTTSFNMAEKIDINKEDIAVRHMAQQLRSIFKARKAERDKRPYTPNKRFDDAAAWIRTAKVVIALGADPNDYIEAQFRFSKSVLLANTLHGQVAQKRYRQYLAVWKDGHNSTVVLKNNPAPRHADLAGLIADFWQELDYYCGSHDLTRREVRDRVIGMRLRYDPLVVMLFSPDEEMKSVFGAGAKERLRQEPHLRVAAQEMNLGMALEYIDEA